MKSLATRRRPNALLVQVSQVAFAYAISGVLFLGSAWADSALSLNAPELEFYVGLTESCCGEDPHPVHGIATPDGGYLVVGKTLAKAEGWGGFALKLGPPAPMGNGVLLEPGESPSFRWSIALGEGSGKSALLNAASSQSSVFLAGLHTESGGHTAMYLAKHSLEDGSLIWEKRFGSQGAIEAIQISAEGGLIAVGVVNAPMGGLEGFKSFGNPFGGQAHAFYLSPEQVAADSPPDSPTWSKTYGQHGTIKALRPLPSTLGGFIFLLGSEGAPPVLMKTDDQGEPIWEQNYPGRFEATDVALHMPGGELQGYTFAGHGGEDGALDAQLTRVDLTGEVSWALSFGDPAGGVGRFAGLDSGDPRLIYDECWGIQGLPDGGVVLGCGTGIEGCELISDGALRSQCASDPRRTWRGYVVRFDAEGEMLWHRVDSFIEEGAEDELPDSASEYVALLPNGGFLSIVDQGFGVGLLALSPESSGASDASPSEQGSGEAPAQGAVEQAREEDERRPARGDETFKGEEEDMFEGEGCDASPGQGGLLVFAFIFGLLLRQRWRGFSVPA